MFIWANIAVSRSVVVHVASGHVHLGLIYSDSILGIRSSLLGQGADMVGKRSRKW